MKINENNSVLAHGLHYYISMTTQTKLNNNLSKGDTMINLINNSIVKFVVVTGLIFKVSLFIFSLI